VAPLGLTADAITPGRLTLTTTFHSVGMEVLFTGDPLELHQGQRQGWGSSTSWNRVAAAAESLVILGRGGARPLVVRRNTIEACFNGVGRYNQDDDRYSQQDGTTACNLSRDTRSRRHTGGSESEPLKSETIGRALLETRAFAPGTVGGHYPSVCGSTAS
jgi:hypothetical protein